METGTTKTFSLNSGPLIIQYAIRRIVSMSGEFMIANAMGLYERDNEQEKLKIPGPIKHEITVNVRLTE